MQNVNIFRNVFYDDAETTLPPWPRKRHSVICHLSEVASRLLCIKCLHIILCAKSAEDCTEVIDLQLVSSHP